MRLGCAAYSYRDRLNSGQMTIEQFVDVCAGMDLDGVELTSYYFPSTERDYLDQIKRHCFRAGQHILGTAVGSRFTEPEEDKRREQVRMTKAWIDHSVILGAPCVRVFAGQKPDGVAEEAAVAWVVECLEECVEYGARAGVCVALENHGGVTATAGQTSRFLQAIESPWFGLNLDFGNFAGDMYGEFEIVAPRAITTHAKVRATGAWASEPRDLDYARIVEIMKTAGYRGYLSIEFEEDDDPMTGVPRFANVLKSHLRS